MRGLLCTAITKEPSSHVTVFQFDSVTVVVESLWRVRVDGRIRLTATDDGQRFGLQDPVDASAAAFGLLEDRRIVSVRVDEVCADILIEFDGATALDIITDSTGYESWAITGPGRSFVGASGGIVRDLVPEV